jgi:hypothetical protein
MNQVKVTANHFFELQIGNHTAYIEFEKTEASILDLLHTQVPETLTGQGVGSKVVEGALNYCKENGLKVIPTCSFVKKYIKNNPQWSDLIANQ